MKNYEFDWMGHRNNLDKILAWRLTVHWKNYGRSPALNTKTCLSVGVFSNDATPETILFKDREGSAHYVGARGPEQEFVTRVSINLDMLTRAWSGDERIYYWGWAEYDGFEAGPRCRTEVCSQIILHGDPNEKETKFTDVFETRFNAIDGLCVHKPEDFKPS